MTKNKGAGAAGRGNMGPGGSILDGGLYSSGIQPTSGTRLPSPRKPLATKRTQRPSPSYSSPTADYMHNPLALSGTKKVDMRGSPTWLHSDNSGMDGQTEGRRGEDVSEMLAERQRAFAAQFSENSGAGSSNIHPSQMHHMAGKMPPPVPPCLNSDPVMYVGEGHPAAGQESDVHMPGGSGAHPHMAMMQDLGPADAHYHHMAGNPHMGGMPMHKNAHLLAPPPLMNPQYPHHPHHQQHMQHHTMPAVDRKKRVGKKGPQSKQATGGGGRWTKEEDQKLREAVAQVGPQNWKMIANDWLGEQRSDVQCLHRWQKVLQPGLVKGPWTKEEDQVIRDCIDRGITKWSEIAERIPGRIGKQCRERWFNHLDPDLKKGGWTEDEDSMLVDAQGKWGNAWTKIAKLLPGRSENAVKNRWNSATRRRTKAAHRAAQDGRPFRMESKSGLNLGVLLNRDHPFSRLAQGHSRSGSDEEDEEDEEDADAQDEALPLQDSKSSELFGADASSLLIVQEAMRYASNGASGKDDDEGSDSHKQMAGHKPSGAPHVNPERVSALVAAAEQNQAAAGLAAVSGSVSGGISPSSLGPTERGTVGAPMLGGPHHHHHHHHHHATQGPGFDAPHEEFEHHDHGVQWDFSPDQSGGLHQSMEFLKGVDHPVDYGTELPTIKGVEEEGMPEEFTLSSSLMNINLDREILDHPSSSSTSGAADFDARSAELMQALLSSQANGPLGSNMSFRARKPADLSIDATGRGGRGSGGLYSPFGPSSRGSFGGRSPTNPAAHLRLLQHSNGGGPRAPSPAAALASLAAGSGLTVVMGGPTNASPRPELASAAVNAAAALGAAAAKAFNDMQVPPKSTGGGGGSRGEEYLLGRGGADFFLDSPSAALRSAASPRSSSTGDHVEV